MNKRNYELLHVWRGLAAILVLLFHLSANMAKEKYWGESAENMREIFHFGGEAGVAFFFVLSGFLITYVHWRDIAVPKLFLRFAIKRAIRIYPAYILVFVALWLSGQFFPNIAGEMKIDILTFIKSILLIPQDKLVVGGTGAPIVVVAWSLQYEITFYFLFSIAILSPRLLLLICIICSIFFAYNIYSEIEHNFIQRFLMHPMAWLFVLGCFAGMPKREKYSDSGAMLEFCSGIMLLFLGCYFYREIKEQCKIIGTELFYGAASYMIISGGCKMENKWRNIELPPIIRSLGDASYSIYLTHFPLVAIFCKLWISFDPARQFNLYAAFALMTTATVIFGVIFHKKIEVKLLDFLNSKSRKYI